MATFVSVYNGLLNTINSLVFVHQVSRGKTNPLASNWMQYVGFAFLLTGTVGEIMIEETRKAFKKNPANQGRVHDTGKSCSSLYDDPFVLRRHCHSTGAFGVVRHPNYAFYALWRVGMAMATVSLFLGHYIGLPLTRDRVSRVHGSTQLSTPLSSLRSLRDTLFPSFRATCPESTRACGRYVIHQAIRTGVVLTLPSIRNTLERFLTLLFRTSTKRWRVAHVSSACFFVLASANFSCLFMYFWACVLYLSMNNPNITVSRNITAFVGNVVLNNRGCGISRVIPCMGICQCHCCTFHCKTAQLTARISVYAFGSISFSPALI
jgi:hypothetical protein